MINKILEKLNNKRILILGYGREGRSSYNFIRKYYPDMIIGIYDKNEIKDSLHNVNIHCGSSYQDILDSYDLIIKSPGVVFHSKSSKDLKKLTSQTDLFLSVYRDQTVGITGTKGKSTTSSLIYHVLAVAGRDAILVGNIGIPVFDRLDMINENTIVVYEMSSHQLEYTGYSPHIGLHLNIFQEHLDHYGTFEKYAAAKENIFKYQQKGDLFIYNKNFIDPARRFKADTLTISEYCEDADMYIKDSRICFKGRELDISEDEILLKGQHNLYNVGAAYCVARYFGVSDEIFYNAVKTFKPLPHRMEYVGEVDGVKYFNDSISTCCETTIHAISSIKNIDTVILGGMDRGIEYRPLVEYLLSSQVRNLILMPDIGQRIYYLYNQLADGQGSDDIEDRYNNNENNDNKNDKEKSSTECRVCKADNEDNDSNDSNDINDCMKGIDSIERKNIYNKKNIFMVHTMEEAVETAKRVTMRGKTCLFSPAAASYGFYKNFEERGDVFKSCVLSPKRLDDRLEMLVD